MLTRPLAVVSRGVPFLSSDLKSLAGGHHPLTAFTGKFHRASPPSGNLRSYSAPTRITTNSHNNRVSDMKEGSSGSSKHIQLATNVNKIQELVNSDPSGGWDKCWEQGLTPWDLGQPTPVLMHLHSKNDLPTGRVLVPGCGSGHDVVAIAGPDRFVVGLEISDRAIKKATELSASSPNEKCFTFLKEDFFTWLPPELFDLIFDYTFFCAIEPNMRSAWGRRMSDLLKPDGELITLIFPISDHVGGPPYSVSIQDYEEALHPMGFKAIHMEENKLAIGPRKGREKIGRWKKFTNQSMI